MPDAKLILDNGDAVFAGMGVANVERDGSGATAVNRTVCNFVDELCLAVSKGLKLYLGFSIARKS